MPSFPAHTGQARTGVGFGKLNAPGSLGDIGESGFRVGGVQQTFSAYPDQSQPVSRSQIIEPPAALVADVPAVLPKYAKAFSYDDAPNLTRRSQLPAPVVAAQNPAVVPFYGKGFDWLSLSERYSGIQGGVLAPSEPPAPPVFLRNSPFTYEQFEKQSRLNGPAPEDLGVLPEIQSVVWENVDETLGSRSFVAPGLAATPSIGNLVLGAGVSTIAEAVAPSVGTLTLGAGVSTVAISTTPTIGNLVLGAAASETRVDVTPSLGELILGAGVSTLDITGNGTVNATVGNLSLTGGANVPQVASTPSIGNLALTGISPVISAQVAPPAGNLSLGSDSSPAKITLSPPIGNLALAGLTQTISLSVSPPAGILTLSGGANTTTGAPASVADTDSQKWLYFLNQ